MERSETIATPAVTPFSRIRRLAPSLANQIAAGEVVERPAAVAKELLENSLDAGARRIDMDLERGGVGLVRVRDDGRGVHRDDLLLALASHATSKIHEASDLERIATLGFRGEALPSIASVARLSLSSRVAGEEAGWRVQVEGGAVVSGPEPAPQPPGTTVEVRELFYNTPARRKFLRTEKTELGHLMEVARRLALSRLDIALHVRHNQRGVLSLPAIAAGGDPARRLAAMFGMGLVEQALPVEQGASGLRLHGWVGTPDSARPQADVQYVYLNGRMVRDRLISHALRQAYEERLSPGRYAVYVLYLELDPAEVDVNVHPTKHEVRFREARMVHDFVYHAVTRTLAGPQTVPAPPAAPPRGPAGGSVPLPPHPPGEGRPAPGQVREALQGYRALSGASRPPPEVTSGAAPLGRPLGLLLGEYLLAEADDGLLLVRLAEARRWLALRRLRAGLAAGGTRSQPLLLPVTRVVGETEAARLEGSAAVLARLGLDLARTGPEGVALRGVPQVLREAEPGRLLDALVAAPLREGAGVEDHDAVLMDCAAHLVRALPAGEDARPGTVALERVLGELGEAARSDTAPVPGEAGRPWARIGREEIAALFERRR